MSPDDLEQALLAWVNDPNYKPVKPRVLAKRFNIPEDEQQVFKRLVKRLVKAGKLSYGSSHLVTRPAAAASAGSAVSAGKPRRSDRITGVFRRAQGGYGFVRPQTAVHADGRDKDIYVAAGDSLDAADGDLVLLRLKKKTGRFGKPRGEIIEIVERETHRFVGTYFESDGAGFVQVDGAVFAQPIAVGDAGAKRAAIDDKVVFEMIRFPSHAHAGEGVVVEILGARGQPGVDTLSIIREFNLAEAFDADALAEARTEADRFDARIDPSRLDLTGATIITIDPVDARDFDDAVSLERIENDHWRLGVHIADVSHFVRPHTALDREAYERATSVYLPDRVLPMLPEIISNGLASLQPDRVRYALSAMIEFSADGAPIATDLHVAAIRSRHRFTYEEIDDYLADPESWKAKLSPEVHALVARMHELAMILRERRMRRGALELSMREIKVDLDTDGRVSGAHLVENTVSHQIIEEFMLATNEAVARRLADVEIPFIRRIHQSPDPRKLSALADFVASLGLRHEGLSGRFELQSLLAEVRGRREEHAVNYAVLRSLPRAVYSPEEEGHFALASDCYCHFTSPIRRYPDLVVHRRVKALLAREKVNDDLDQLAALGQHCSNRERRAEDAERELTKLKLLAYLKERVGEEMQATITGVAEFGFFVQGVDIPAEGLVHVSSLADDLYHYDKRAHTLSGRKANNSFRLGDRVRVEVVRVDVDRRELDFRFVGRERAEPKAGAARKRESKPADTNHQDQPATSFDSTPRRKTSGYGRSSRKPKPPQTKAPRKKRPRRKG